MTRIVKAPVFFKSYYKIIMVLLWISLCLFTFLDSNFESKNLWFYLGMAILYTGWHFYDKDLNKEYIAWNENEVRVSAFQQNEMVYAFEDINFITITPNNFIIKSGPASGTMITLEGFKKEDIELLKSRFSSNPLHNV
ncbi:hypothetical protein [Gillisia limnaea]|uniref:Uncharacterized protein n=1 Tax=Gillisia limnaea (strain DSM 15749 / LMG 21470 / R-8282) TaxID=865937 RepID=H2BU16_GILLR|nr:hypothetical protein [Gillisia limnaea]EHQ01612.1 hypothetical protein Gilli_0925 [Gillisia limnaea DSM 15749]